MVSEINPLARSAAATPAVAAGPRAAAPAGGPAPAAAPAPRVMAPKPVEIQYDAHEVRQNLQEAVHMLNEQMAATKRGLGFAVDQSLETPIVTVRSASTGEVIRQIPNETVIKVAHNLDRMKGLLFNGKA